MAVDRVVAEVGHAADEPFGERRLAVVENLLERLVPVDELGLLGPELVPAARSNDGEIPCRFLPFVLPPIGIVEGDAEPFARRPVVTNSESAT